MGFRNFNYIESTKRTGTSDKSGLARRPSFCYFSNENDKYVLLEKIQTLGDGAQADVFSFSANDTILAFKEFKLHARTISETYAKTDKEFRELIKKDIANIKRFAEKEASLQKLFTNIGYSFVHNKPYKFKTIYFGGANYSVISYPRAMLIMPYCKGIPLTDFEYKSDREFLIIFLKIMRCIQAMHDKGYVHEDIHRNNILIETTQNDFIINLIDYGFTTKIGENLKLPRGLVSDIKPPEFHNRKIVIANPKHDIYTIGLTMQTLLKFRGQHLSYEFYESILSKMQEKDPEKRPEISEVITEIEKSASALKIDLAPTPIVEEKPIVKDRPKQPTLAELVESTVTKIFSNASFEAGLKRIDNAYQTQQIDKTKYKMLLIASIDIYQQRRLSNQAKYFTSFGFSLFGRYSKEQKVGAAHDLKFFAKNNMKFKIEKEFSGGDLSKIARRLHKLF